MEDEIKNLQDEEVEILKRLELSPLKNFVFTNNNPNQNEDTHR